MRQCCGSHLSLSRENLSSGFPPSLIQTRLLYNNKDGDARNFGFRKKSLGVVLHVAKPKVTTQLIYMYIFVYVYTKAGSHTAHNYDRKQLRMLKQLMNMDQGLLETEF